MNYSSDPQEFIKVAKPHIGESFLSCLIEAIRTGKKLNYYDRLPRYVLKEVSIDTDTSTLTFVFEDGVIEKIQYQDYTIDQSNSHRKKFYISNKENRDYNVIIFNC
ncbi:MAG: hypothetical protein PHE09_02465 [Oscillospiraceae bacterium]|nr:hypothetical protein [Oscillospiraceae bacterium]